MADVAREEKSHRQTELIGLFVKCGVVKLVKKIWKRCEDQKLLEQNKDLPPAIETSLTVIYYILYYYCYYYYCIIVIVVIVNQYDCIKWIKNRQRQL